MVVVRRGTETVECLGVWPSSEQNWEFEHCFETPNSGVGVDGPFLPTDEFREQEWVDESGDEGFWTFQRLELHPNWRVC